MSVPASASVDSSEQQGPEPRARELHRADDVNERDESVEGNDPVLPRFGKAGRNHVEDDTDCSESDEALPKRDGGACLQVGRCPHERSPSEHQKRTASH